MVDLDSTMLLLGGALKRIAEGGSNFMSLTQQFSRVNDISEAGANGHMLFRKAKWMVGFAVDWRVGCNPSLALVISSCCVIVFHSLLN